MRILIWCILDSFVQGGRDPRDALNCRSFFAKELLIIGLFCGRWRVKIRHPMTLSHPEPILDTSVPWWWTRWRCYWIRAIWRQTWRRPWYQTSAPAQTTPLQTASYSCGTYFDSYVYMYILIYIRFDFVVGANMHVWIYIFSTHTYQQFARCCVCHHV